MPTHTDTSSPPEPLQLMRLLDANVNRGLEGLRTLEDVCRLVHEDAINATRAKSLRHALAEIARAIPRLDRLAARDVSSDAGTSATTTAEQTRLGWADVVAAACERTLQAMRNLEEFSKLLPDPAVSTRLKSLRYRAYDDLAQIELALHSQAAGAGEGTRRKRLSAARLYLLIGCNQPLDEFTRLVVDLAQAGVDCFQLRDKTAEAMTLMQYASAAVSALTGQNALLIVNDRVDIAIASGADGVHLGQEDLSLADGRRLAGTRLLIGVSTHDVQQATLAADQGADYIGCGPTFPSKTKDFADFAGPTFLNQISQLVDLPAFAIGGIDESNVDQVLAVGVTRIAVSNAILGHRSPTAAAKALREKLRSTD